MWFDTLSFRLEISHEEYERVQSLAQSGFAKFDYDLDVSAGMYLLKLGSFYAGLRLAVRNPLLNSVSEKYLLNIEYSGHKWTKGVNGIAGLPLVDSSPFAPLRLALIHCGIKYDPKKIEVRRADIGSLWRMQSRATDSFWSAIGRMHYPRRKATIHPSSITWGGLNAQTREKIYDKYLEQRSHKKDLPEDPRIKDYLEGLKGVVRFEVEYHSKWLRAHDINTLADLRKAVKGGHMENDFKARESKRIGQLPTEANRKLKPDELLRPYPGLYRFWTEILKSGHKSVLETYKSKGAESRYYKYKKRLSDLNVPLVVTAEEDPLRIIYIM